MNGKKYKCKGWLVLLSTIMICWILLSSCKSRKMVNKSDRDSVKVVSDNEYISEKLVDTTSSDNVKEMVTTIMYDSTAPSSFEIIKGRDAVTIMGSGKIKEIIQREKSYQKTKNGIISGSTASIAYIDSTKVDDQKISKEVIHSDSLLKLVMSLIGIIVVLLMYIFRKPIFKQIKL